MFKRLLTLAIGCATALVAAEQVHIPLKEDGREWKRTEEMRTQETYSEHYKPVGEEHEEIVREVAAPSDESPQEYLKAYLKDQDARCEPINNDTFEVWVDEGTPQERHAWYRVIKSDKYTTIVGYSTDKTDQVDQLRPKWEGILQDTNVVTS